MIRRLLTISLVSHWRFCSSDVFKNFAMNLDTSFIFLPEDFARYIAHGVNIYALEFYDTDRQRGALGNPSQRIVH